MVGFPQPFVLALLTATAVAGGLTVVGYRHRQAAGGRAFTAMAGAVTVWAFGDLTRLLAADWGAYVWGMNISFLGSSVAVTAGLVFVLQYTSTDHGVTRRTLGLLAVEPVVAVLLAWTTEVHGLMWTYGGRPMTAPGVAVSMERGVAFDAHLGYNYALMAVLLALLALFYVRARGPYRWQTLLMLVGGLVPGATNVLWQVVGRGYPATVDPTPVSFVVTGLLFTVGLHSFDLLELAPVGRHTVVEELHDAVLTVNEADRVVDANPVARELLASPGEGLVGADASAVVPEYDAVVEREGRTEDLTMTVDGERRYFDVRQSPLDDAAGGLVGRVVVLRDLTERRRVEKRYQLLIENSTDLIDVLGDDGTIEYVSPSVRKILGFEPDRVEGTDALGYVHPDDRVAVAEQFDALLAEPGQDIRVDYRLRTADGSFREVESRARNLLDDPVVEGIVVNSRDITERRERERRLQQRNEQLEEFASVISHDLRGPLSVAHGYARMLDDELDDERLGKVVAANERMEELIEDLLTLAREGRAVSEPAPVDLQEAARRAWGIVDTGGADLAVATDRALIADDTRLRQLLENLFINAAQHGTADADGAAAADGGTGQGATVTVGTDDTGFYVADDGPGIPPEERKQVFQAGESGAEAGDGLGLAIVERIAAAHGWEVQATESEDGGARFEFDGVGWVG